MVVGRELILRKSGIVCMLTGFVEPSHEHPFWALGNSNCHCTHLVLRLNRIVMDKLHHCSPFIEELIKILTKLGGCSLVDEVNHVNMVVSYFVFFLCGAYSFTLNIDVSINFYS